MLMEMHKQRFAQGIENVLGFLFHTLGNLGSWKGQHRLWLFGFGASLPTRSLLVCDALLLWECDSLHMSLTSCSFTFLCSLSTDIVRLLFCLFFVARAEKAFAASVSPLLSWLIVH